MRRFGLSAAAPLVLLLLLLPQLLTVARAAPRVGVTGIRMVEAGVGGLVSPALNWGAVVCPRRYRRGLNIECLTTGWVRRVTIKINGRVARVEREAPYMAAGNLGRNMLRMDRVPAVATVECLPGRGAKLVRRVRFECRQEVKKNVVEDQQVKRPPPQVQRPPPQVQRPPPQVQRPPPQVQRPPPQVVVEQPELGDDDDEMGKRMCVGKEVGGRIVISAKMQGEVGGWKMTANGIEYKPGGDGSIEKPGTDAIPFYFLPAKRSRYFFTMRTSAPHPTEHNDAFVRFNHENGFNLRKGGTERKAGTGWLKAYSNRGKNALGIYSVDHNPHTFVTADELLPGTIYSVELAGRSSRYTIHELILFPCGNNCNEGSNAFRAATRNLNPTGCIDR